MTIQKIAGRGLLIPQPPFLFGQSPAYSGVVLDGATEKAAFLGSVWNKDGTTKTITKVGFRFGNVTKDATTDIQVSLQDWTNTSAPAKPDDVADQTVLVGNANITANTWREVTLGTTRNVAYGEKVAIVFEFSTFVAADSIHIAGIGGTGVGHHTCFTRLYTGGAWSTSYGNADFPNVVLGFDDGTWGTLDGALCWSAINAITFNNGSTPDELALEFSLPFPAVADAVWATGNWAGDTDFILYDGTTPIANGSRSIDKDQRAVAAQYYPIFPLGAHVSLAKDTVYRLAMKPTSATNISEVYTVEVNTAAYWQSQEGGEAFKYTQRVDAGAWDSPTTTKRLLVGLRLIGFDDGAGAAGGGLRLAGHGGLAS